MLGEMDASQHTAGLAVLPAEAKLLVQGQAFRHQRPGLRVLPLVKSGQGHIGDGSGNPRLVA